MLSERPANQLPELISVYVPVGIGALFHHFPYSLYIVWQLSIKNNFYRYGLVWISFKVLDFKDIHNVSE